MGVDSGLFTIDRREEMILDLSDPNFVSNAESTWSVKSDSRVSSGTLSDHGNSEYSWSRGNTNVLCDADFLKLLFGKDGRSNLDSSCKSAERPSFDISGLSLKSPAIRISATHGRVRRVKRKMRTENSFRFPTVQ